MLFVSLFFSAVLLLLANLAYRKPPHSVIKVGGLALLAIIIPAMGFAFSAAVCLVAITLFMLALVLRVAARPKVFLCLSLVAVLVVHGIMSFLAFQETANLLARYSYTSIEARLPEAPSLEKPGSIPETTLNRLAELELALKEHGLGGSTDRLRIRSLKNLHEDTLITFINSSGFGVGRGGSLHARWLGQVLRFEPPIPEPGPRTTPFWSTGVTLKPPSNEGPPASGVGFGILQASIIDFSNPRAFGYFKDRRHVAGFQEHQFSKTPEVDKPWKLETLDLIGLVVHPEPVGYVTNNLPRMDELRKAQTRMLDEFEKLGLESLRTGEDLFVRDTTDGRRRVLGGIRSAKQCVECHLGERGALLGAFSYTLGKGNIGSSDR